MGAVCILKKKPTYQIMLISLSSLHIGHVMKPISRKFLVKSLDGSTHAMYISRKCPHLSLFWGLRSTTFSIFFSRYIHWTPKLLFFLVPIPISPATPPSEVGVLVGCITWCLVRAEIWLVCTLNWSNKTSCLCHWRDIQVWRVFDQRRIFWTHLR